MGLETKMPYVVLDGFLSGIAVVGSGMGVVIKTLFESCSELIKISSFEQER